MYEDDIKITVDGHDYTIEEDGSNFIILRDFDEENVAEVRLSECGEYYEYDYSPLFADMNECSGISEIYKHDSITEFFRWVISTCQ